MYLQSYKIYSKFDHFLANSVQKGNQQLLNGPYPLEISCPSKWDGMLCWPPTMINTTVAIPCNASKIFVETLQETIETVQKESIPGEPFFPLIKLIDFCILIRCKDKE